MEEAFDYGYIQYQGVYQEIMKILPDKSHRHFSRLSNKWVIISLLIITTLIWLAVAAIPDKQLEVSFLDVGQGDAIFIQTPSGQQILIDGGPDPENICLALGDKLPFWDKSLDLFSTYPYG